MDQTREFIEWCKRMGCPPNACDESVMQMFSKGLLGVVWEDISKRTLPLEEADAVRKFVLLHKLKNNIPDENIDVAKEFSKLKVESLALDKQIVNLEAVYTQQDYVLREKMQKLRNIRHMYSRQRAKKHLLKMKKEQTSSQLRDLMDMQSVCQHLKPLGATREIDLRTLNDILAIVRSLSSGGNKKEIYNKVEEVLGNVDISVLYSHLYQSIKDSVDNLAKQDTDRNIDKKTTEEVIDTAIGNLCGKHIEMLATCNLYSTRSSRSQENIFKFIRKIEECSSVDISDWLELTLEVEKLKAEIKGLQIEIDKIQEINQTNNYIFPELDRLTFNIRDVDVETKELISSVRDSLILLKSAPMLVTNMKAKVQLELQKISDMRLVTQANNSLSIVMRDDLITELDIFHDNLDLAALRTITLKGNSKFTKCCFNESSVSIVPLHTSHVMLQFPMIEIPIYSLMECCKNLRAMFACKDIETLRPCILEELTFPISKPERMEFAVKDLLILIKVVCEKIRDEYDRCIKVQHDWSKQTVQKVMEINESTVDNSSFQEWIKGYTLLYSMLNVNSSTT